MNTIDLNLKKLQEQVTKAELSFGRKPGSVRILAVSKGQALEKILQAVASGQRAFGENYLQEALSKIEALTQANLAWHYIGAIQANKTRAIAENFAWVHSVDRLSIAQRLNDQRPATLPPLNVCIQVNIDDETSKAGTRLQTLPELAQALAQLPHLKLRGLMTIPQARQDFTAQRKPFRQLRLALENLQQQGFTVDTLSMGMSQDFTAAIAEGATIIRIGTAIFGERRKSL